MCRWICFKAKQSVLLADLLTRTRHSIINQSFDSRLRMDDVRPLNGDGFAGTTLQKYPHEPPCIFTSVLPAWNNPNLTRLCDKLKSNLVFCHVRAASRQGASSGFPISETNCHPFNFGRLMWQHNGYLAGFSKFKRKLQALVPDRIFNTIHGNTDSEWAFGLFLSQLKDCEAPCFTQEELKQAVLDTIRIINQLSAEAQVTEPSLLNFAVTDGEAIICTRYTNTSTREAASLYWSSGSRFAPDQTGEYKMQRLSRREEMVIISSEPLTFHRAEWCKIPDNTLVVVTAKLNVLLYPIVDENWCPDAEREEEVPWWTVATRLRKGMEDK
ncbi:glutamine amidotransferase subunit [Sorochytrium milnesiophthora]